MRSAPHNTTGLKSRFLGRLSRSESSVHYCEGCQLSGLRARFPAGSRRMRSLRLLRRGLVRGFVRVRLGFNLGVERSVDFGDDDDGVLRRRCRGAAEDVSDFLAGCGGDDVAFSSTLSTRTLSARCSGLRQTNGLKRPAMRARSFITSMRHS